VSHSASACVHRACQSAIDPQTLYMQATTRYARLQHEFLRQLACRNWWVAGHLAGCAYNVVQYTQIHCASTAIVREILPRQLLISGKHPYICTYYIATGSPCVPVQIFWSVRGTGKGRKPWHPPAQTTCNIYKILDSGAIIRKCSIFQCVTVFACKPAI
jgi:hypothetical protein